MTNDFKHFHYGHLNDIKEVVLPEPHESMYPSNRHQLRLQDHVYDTTASCGMSVYVPAFTVFHCGLTVERSLTIQKVAGSNFGQSTSR